MATTVAGPFYPTFSPESATLRHRPIGAFTVFENHTPSFQNQSFQSPSFQTLSSQNPSWPLKLPEPSRPSEVSPPTREERLKALGIAGLMLGNAILLRRIPAIPSSLKYISTDWKDWAKILLGIGAVNQVNKALDWHPPAWLGAIETVAVINPLMLGRAGLPQLPAMAALVSGLVAGTNYVSNKAEPYLQEKMNIEPKVTRLVLSAVTTVLGLFTYPSLARSGLLGKSAQAESNMAAASGMTACARCGGYHGLFCMADIGEFFGAMGNWFHSKLGEKKA